MLSGRCLIPSGCVIHHGYCVSPTQVPEMFGPIRTIAEGRGETVLIGTTKHFVLQGSLDGEFVPITQVNASQEVKFVFDEKSKEMSVVNLLRTNH